MNKFLRTFLCLFLLLFAAHNIASAQNCTVNANGNHTICPTPSLLLQGSYQGSTAVNPVWTQVSGPAVTLSSTTASGTSATATVTGTAPGGVYTFRLSSKCVDGTPIQDDATYTVTKVTQAVASTQSTVTMCPGSYTFTANAPGTNETGTWSVVSGKMSPPTGNNATITLGTNDNTVGTNVLRWTISTNGTPSCQTTSTFTLINLGGQPNTAMTPIHVGCYTVTGSATLAAPYGGDPAQPLQRGTWSFISGPSTPTFGDVHVNNTSVGNLLQGTYVLRWTVAGQCQNYTSDVTVTVDSPSQGVTNAGSANLVYCDGRTSTALSGASPQFAGETVAWTQTAGPTTNTHIISTNTSATEVTGLDGSSNYTFHYTITNTFGCSSSGDYKISYTIAPSITLGASLQTLPCSTTVVSLPYTIAGGNVTQWELVSAPDGAIIDTAASTGGFNNFNTATASPQVLTGLSKIGTYIIRFRRFSNDGSGGCSDAFADERIIISNAPYVANAGTPQNLNCNVTSTSLAANLPLTSESGTGSWSQISGPNTAAIANKALNTTGISGLVPGVYTFRWSVTGGELSCGDTHADVTVTVAQAPTVVNAGVDISTCFGTTVTLNGNTPAPGETGTWSFVSANPAVGTPPTITNIHDPHTTTMGFTAATATAYTFRWTISNSCSSITDDVVVNTNTTNGPQQATAGPDQCLLPSATSITLAGNTPGTGETGTWTTLSAPNTPHYSSVNANNAVINNPVAGTYKLEWKLDKNSCTTTRDTVVITVSPAVTTAVITGGNDQHICGITAVTLTANAPGTNETGTWTQVSGAGNIVFATPHAASTTVTGIQAGRYQFAWTISNNACTSSSVTATYSFDATPTTALAMTPITLCNATTTPLSGTVPTVGTGLWSVVSGPGNVTFSDPTSPTATISGLVLGTYTLQWSITSGAFCTPSTAQVTVTVNQSAKAGTNQVLCNQTVTLLAGNDGSKGTWTQTAGPAATIISNSDNTAIVTGLTIGSNYTFQYHMTTFNCGTNNATVNVSVDGPPTVANAGTDQALCTNGQAASMVSVTLAGNTPVIGTGTWSILSSPAGSTPVFSNVNSPTSTFSNLAGGTYVLQWQIASTGCMGTTSSNDILRIDINEPPTTAQPMPDITAACTGKITLSGTVPTVGIGTWTQVGTTPTVATIDAPNSPTTTISGITSPNATAYQFMWTITNGTGGSACPPSSATVNVTVKDVTPTTATVTAATQSVCTVAGTASITNLGGNTPSVGTGTWSVISQTGAGTAAFGAVNSGSSGVSGLTAGQYVLGWTIGNTSDCSTTATVTVTVSDPPTADAGPNATFCYLSPVTLAAVTPTSGTGVWTVTTNPNGTLPDPVFSSTTATNPTVTGLSKGTYVFTWTVTNGSCTSASNVTIAIENCQIAVAKTAGTPVPQGNNKYQVTYVFNVKNTGDATVSNVQVQDDMTTTFPSPMTYTIGSVSTTGGLTAVGAGAFDGTTAHSNLLDPTTSSLAAGASGTITVTVNVTLHN